MQGPLSQGLVRQSGKPCIKGDFDDDEDVDPSDFSHLQICFSGSAVGFAPGCDNADLDADLDVDGADLNAFLACMGGPGQPPACANQAPPTPRSPLQTDDVVESLAGGRTQPPM